MFDDRIGRAQIEKNEANLLASYAAHSIESQGRKYSQPEHPLRTCYQRDRDRIIHSAAFRRLEYKTQVFIPHEADHYRTRLTHTIEVAQISRTIARSLRFNEDLAEAISLAHDLGHTPFGHSGEDVLGVLLASTGGFNHNRQSLRVVDLLEQRYEEHPGLNLNYEVREGIAKHDPRVTVDLPEFNPELQPTLEATLVDIADEIAYNSHDIDDGLSSGIITFEMLYDSPIAKAFAIDPGNVKSYGQDSSRYALVRKLINRMVTDVIDETDRRVRKLKVTSLVDVRNCTEPICCYSNEMSGDVIMLKTFLQDNLYHHQRMTNMSDWAKEIIETLFHRFKADPSLMSERFQQRLAMDSAEIVIADYIAGMTDRYAIKMYEKVG